VNTSDTTAGFCVIKKRSRCALPTWASPQIMTGACVQHNRPSTGAQLVNTWGNEPDSLSTLIHVCFTLAPHYSKVLNPNQIISGLMWSTTVANCAVLIKALLWPAHLHGKHHQLTAWEQHYLLLFCKKTKSSQIKHKAYLKK